jgi:kynurenine formamidase
LTDTQTLPQRWTRRPSGSNWGDFGPDDQLGRMNLITPERRLAAIREVHEGKAFVLSLPLDYPGGEAADAARRAPVLHSNRLQGHAMCNFPLTESDICCDDSVTMSLQYSTQWDALVHWGRLFDVDGSGEKQPVYYNGFRAGEDIVCGDDLTGPCATKLGIENMAATGVQGRGVLVNLVAEYGAGRTLVDYDMLLRAIDNQRIEIREGDMLLLYTGYCDAVMAMNKQPDEEALHRAGAVLRGSDERLLDWIEKSGIAALIADNQAVEGFDPELKEAGESGLLPLHDRCLFKLGVHLGELWWLKDLAEHLGRSGRHAFLLTAPPLRLPGAAGSPVTPVATV